MRYKLKLKYPTLPLNWEVGMIVGKGDRSIRYSPENGKYTDIQLHDEEVEKFPQFWEKYEEFNLEPLECIIDDIYYTKGFNGMYYMWISPTHLKDGESIGQIHIPEMRRRIEQAKFKKTILYCTNDVNKKL